MIIRTKRYLNELEKILRFIAKDSPNNSQKFKITPDARIDNIPAYPFSYRKSILFDDENIRELIFKKYVVIFKIFDCDIYILGIYKSNLWDV